MDSKRYLPRLVLKPGENRTENKSIRSGWFIETVQGRRVGPARQATPETIQRIKKYKQAGKATMTVHGSKTEIRN